MKDDTAGDPMTGLKWTHRTTEKIAAELQISGIVVSPNTVGRLLKALGFSLRVNHKKKSHGSKADRDKQFQYISRLRKQCAEDQIPIISVDAKKKEKIGNFKNEGRAWSETATEVNDHDFPSLAEGRAIPYGIYDLLANKGTVVVGISRDTPQFAVDCVTYWWKEEGRMRYPNAAELVILADSGGSNSARSRVWKCRLQEQLCDQFGIAVTVAHYPPGTSKWNPIEHRLFSEISKNWAGRPLDSYETILNYLRTTKTSTGLEVTAHLVAKEYKKGVRVSDKKMKELRITRDNDLPKQNYVIKPSTSPDMIPVEEGCRLRIGEFPSTRDLPLSVTQNPLFDLPESDGQNPSHYDPRPGSLITNLIFSMVENVTTQVQKIGSYF